MDARDFDDDVRVIQRDKIVVLSDGRKFSHKHIFDEFRRTGFEKEYVKKAIGMIVVSKPIPIVFDTKESDDFAIDFEEYLREKRQKELEKERPLYTQAIYVLNDTDSREVLSYEDLLENGVVYNFS